MTICASCTGQSGLPKSRKMPVTSAASKSAANVFAMISPGCMASSIGQIAELL